MSGPREGEDCGRIARALKASVIVDADAYFRHARAAMMKAKRRIMLIGWDFDAAITLIREDEASDGGPTVIGDFISRSEEHTSELQSLMRISYAVFCLKKKKKNNKYQT